MQGGREGEEEGGGELVLMIMFTLESVLTSPPVVNIRSVRVCSHTRAA